MIQEASALGLLRTVLIILLVWFGVKILARLFAPFLIRFAAKKVQERFGNQFRGYADDQKQHNHQQKSGETMIDKMPGQQKRSNKTVGEYIEYEEID